MQLSNQVSELLKKIFGYGIYRVEITRWEPSDSCIAFKLVSGDTVEFDFETLEKVSRLFGSKKFHIPEWEVISPGCHSCAHGRKTEMAMSLEAVNFSDLPAQILAIDAEITREQAEEELRLQKARNEYLAEQTLRKKQNEERRAREQLQKAQRELAWAENNDRHFQETFALFESLTQNVQKKRYLAELVKDLPYAFILFLFFKQQDRSKANLRKLWDAKQDKLQKAFYPLS